MAKQKSKPSAPLSPEAARARRIEELAEKGPPPPRNPHAFIEEKMRNDRRAMKVPGGPKR